MLIKIVGPCASGKSTLARKLREAGYVAHSAAQDHSHVPDMWQRINRPDLLIYLDVSLVSARQRGRTGRGWDQIYLDEQHRRLGHARRHCDLYLATDQWTEAQVLQQVLDFLQEKP
jgi:deoxyadenosine/deoxycytidine kinase